MRGKVLQNFWEMLHYSHVDKDRCFCFNPLDKHPTGFKGADGLKKQKRKTLSARIPAKQVIGSEKF